MRRIRWVVGTMVCLAQSTLVYAQSNVATCELHIWPTRTYNAFYYGATNIMLAGNHFFTYDLKMSPREIVAKKLEDGLSVDAQGRLLASMNLGQSLNDYKRVIHEAPAFGASKYSNWIDKTVGYGTRDTDSKSPCYAELHIIIITLERTALTKKFETAFIWRRFGSSETTQSVERWGTSTGAPHFEFNADPVTPEGAADLGTAFQTSVARFLQRKGVVP